MSRFEQAHAPSYKLRDISMIERGNAPEHVRRRVEAVKTKAIHVPTRPEGRERARQAVNDWRALSEAPMQGDDILSFRRRVEAAHDRAEARRQHPAFEPAPASGAMRLYRADPPRGRPAGELLFTTNRAEAERLAGETAGSKLTYVDVPSHSRSKLTPSRVNPDSVFLVAAELAAGRRSLTAREIPDDRVETGKQVAAKQGNAVVLPDQRPGAPPAPALPASETILRQKEAERATIEAAMPLVSAADQKQLVDAWRILSAAYDAKIAAARQQESRQAQNTVAETVKTPRDHVDEKARPEEILSPISNDRTDSSMANIARARRAAQQDIENLDEIAKVIPAEMQSEFIEARGRLHASTAKLIASAEAAEADRPQMTGATFDPPRAREAVGFFNEKVSKGDVDEIHYHRLAADGSKAALAFIDKGRNIDVKDWKNEETVRKALKHASEKWGAITLNGNDQYKALAIRVAAENGYEIANLELLERFEQAKQRVAGQVLLTAPEVSRQNETPAPAQGPIARTAAERSVALEEIKERVAGEARRETRQANFASATGRNAAEGEAAHPFRSQSAAAAARQAAQVTENDPARPIPTNRSQSEELERARLEQKKILNEQAQQQQTPTTKSIQEKLAEAAREREAREAQIYGQDYDQEM